MRTKVRAVIGEAATPGDTKLRSVATPPSTSNTNVTEKRILVWSLSL